MSEVKPAMEVSLYTFVTNTPPPVVRLLVELAPVFAAARWVAEVSSWRSQRTSESWLAVFLWWTLCLTATPAFRYLLPLLVVLPALMRQFSPSIPYFRSHTTPTSNPVPPATEATVSHALTDVQTLESLIPHVPPLADWSLPPLVLGRIVLAAYLPYLLLTVFVSASVIFAILGTILLTWRSPWATGSRRILLRSGWACYIIGRSWSLISGQPSPSMNFQISPALTTTPLKSNNASIEGVELPEPALLRFTFCVIENQRWWMGLDWTAALLPSDRPSWSSLAPSLSALQPPGSMSLPGPVTVYLPLPSGPLGYRMKRTSKWRWEDTEWRVVVRATGKDGQVHVDRVKIDPPMDAEAGGAARLVDAVGKGLRRGQSVSVDHGSPLKDAGRSATMAHEKDSSASGTGPVGNIEEVLTDSDGWMYADNKWETPGPKAGLGKYTRMRRWTRIAVLEERIEAVRGEPGMSTGPSTPMEKMTSNATPEKVIDAIESSQPPTLRQRMPTGILNAM